MSGGNNSTYLSKPKSCKFCEIFKNTSFHRTPLVVDPEVMTEKLGCFLKYHNRFYHVRQRLSEQLMIE